jgi:hypothetical protein
MEHCSCISPRKKTPGSSGTRGGLGARYFRGRLDDAEGLYLTRVEMRLLVAGDWIAEVSFVAANSINTSMSFRFGGRVARWPATFNPMNFFVTDQMELAVVYIRADDAVPAESPANPLAFRLSTRSENRRCLPPVQVTLSS